jgi:hypothetical protein
VPTALGILIIDTQPSRAGLMLAVGPSGPWRRNRSGYPPAACRGGRFQRHLKRLLLCGLHESNLDARLSQTLRKTRVAEVRLRGCAVLGVPPLVNYG